MRPLTDLLCSVGNFVESANVAFDTTALLQGGRGSSECVASSAPTGRSNTNAATPSSAAASAVTAGATSTTAAPSTDRENDDDDDNGADEDVAAVAAAAESVVLRRRRPTITTEVPSTLGARLASLQTSTDADVSRAQALSTAAVESLGQRAARVLASIEAGMYHPDPDPLDPYVSAKLDVTILGIPHTRTACAYCTTRAKLDVTFSGIDWNFHILVRVLYEYDSHIGETVVSALLLYCVRTYVRTGNAPFITL